jgi:flagellar motor switch protein FliM
MKDRITQQGVDAVLAKRRAAKPRPGEPPQVFDFGRPDRIGKAQLHALHQLHETFGRNLSASLSAYLRNCVSITETSLEQLSYGEFLEGLPDPTSLLAVSLHPYAATAVLEMNQQLVFTMLEILLGGRVRGASQARREVTDIEESLAEVLFRIVLHDLREAWRPSVTLDFGIERMEWEPQSLRVLAAHDPVVALGFEVRLGETVGAMNLAYPSVAMKSISQRFDREWSRRKAEPSEDEQQRMAELVRRCGVELDARLNGVRLKVRDLLEIEEGDVLQLDYPVGRPVDCTLNGTRKFRGRLAGSRTKKAFVIEETPEA